MKLPHGRVLRVAVLGHIQLWQIHTTALHFIIQQDVTLREGLHKNHTQVTHTFSSESTTVKQQQQHWLTCISALLAARMPTLESGSRCRLSVLSLFRKPCALCRVTCFRRLVSMTSRHCSTIAVSSFVPPAAHPTQQSLEYCRKHLRICLMCSREQNLHFLRSSHKKLLQPESLLNIYLHRWNTAANAIMQNKPAKELYQIIIYICEKNCEIKSCEMQFMFLSCGGNKLPQTLAQSFQSDSNNI